MSHSQDATTVAALFETENIHVADRRGHRRPVRSHSAASSPNSPVKARPELLCSPCRPRHRRRIARAAAALNGAATISLLASARAFAEPADRARHLAQEHHASAIVLGLDPPEAPYQDRVAVLIAIRPRWLHRRPSRVPARPI